MEGQKGYTDKVLGAVLGTEETFNKWLLLLGGFLSRCLEAQGPEEEALCGLSGSSQAHPPLCLSLRLHT